MPGRRRRTSWAMPRLPCIVPRALARDTDVKLVMAGGASYCDNYSRELQTHAGERIKLLEWVSGEALDELLTNAMMFVLPSDLEGLSLALLDAMGAGLC